MVQDVRLAELELPVFGLPTVEPTVPAEIYQKRIQAAQKVWLGQGLTAVVVYSDREHSANMAYLTGYDARFEEALLIFDLQAERSPTLLVGNEGWAYASASPLSLKKVLYQNFSLPGQPRGSSDSLTSILRSSGVTEGGTVGVVGWKSFADKDSAGEKTWLDIPSYIADTLRSLVGENGAVTNITDTLIDPIDGLKNINDVDQLAVFEFAATHTSQALRNVLFGLQPGMSEYDAVQLMQLNGMPHSVHLMLSSGERTQLGLASPSSKRIEQGDPFTMAFGLWGALNARAGFVVRDATELPDSIRDYIDKLVVPYFRAVVDWYEIVGIGVTGGELYDAIHKHIGDAFFGVTLNPGHFIHFDEWTHSPVYLGSKVPLKSGMALQVDVIPATGTDYFTTNIEDGIALADGELRAAFAKAYPEAWTRIQARRDFMEHILGIRLKPEVLPFSNIPAYLPPYLLSPQRAMQVIDS